MNEIENFFLKNIIEEFNNKKGSDIHISPNNYIGFRIKGSLIKNKNVPQLKVKQTIDIFKYLLNYIPEKLQNFVKENLENEMSSGFSVTINYKEKSYRFRINAAVNNGGYFIVMRIIDSTPPDLEVLGFNENTLEGLKGITTRKAGLFLVVGATGSGKSTTLASMIKLMNQTYEKNIITLEDPIEFEHESIKCQVVQKELGRDFKIFPDALKSAMREDPDVILVGEIRDEVSLELALEASETGHIVFATLHTETTVDAIQRLVSMTENTALTRDRLASILLGAIAQTLVLDVNDNRIGIWEILINDKSSAALIREGNDTQLKGVLDTKQNSQSFNKTIREFYAQGRITEETAFRISPDPKYLNLEEVEKIKEIENPIEEVEKIKEKEENKGFKF